MMIPISNINLTEREEMKKIASTSMIAVAALLSACGGGGGGDSGAVPVPPVVVPPVVTPPVVDANPLQTTVAAATYAPNSVLSSAYNTLNGARQAYGVGLLAQNAKLDQSAANHAAYVSARWGAQDFANVGHLEDASKSGFTGVNPSDRIAYAGYTAATTGEVLTTFISVDGVQSDPGVVAVNGLMSGPYHRFNLLDSSKEIGIADASAVFVGEGGKNHTVVLNSAVAFSDKSQLPNASWVGVWPLDQAKDVMYGFAGESPNPIPANGGACAGYPASIQIRNGLVLGTTSFTMVETAGNVPVTVQLSTASSDVNPSQARTNSAYIIPFKPLKLATQYTVRFVGTSGTNAIDKTWSFTTGNINTKMIYGCNPS
ncbi:CAP domain-containing protein [Janthinobacterium lividum]